MTRVALVKIIHNIHDVTLPHQFVKNASHYLIKGKATDLVGFLQIVALQKGAKVSQIAIFNVSTHLIDSLIDSSKVPSGLLNSLCVL